MVVLATTLELKYRCISLSKCISLGCLVGIEYFVCRTGFQRAPSCFQSIDSIRIESKSNFRAVYKLGVVTTNLNLHFYQC